LISFHVIQPDDGQTLWPKHVVCDLRLVN